MSNVSKFDAATISEIEKRIENGVVFEASSKVPVAVSDTAKWIVETGSKHLIIHTRLITTNGNELTFNSFKNVNVTDLGTPVLSSNKNDSSIIRKTAKIYENSTFSGGNPRPSIYLPGSVGVGSRSIGQFDKEGAIRILAPNSIYAASVDNDGTIDANVEIYLLWSELDNPLSS